MWWGGDAGPSRLYRATATCTVVVRMPGLRPNAVAGSESSVVGIPACSNSGTFPVGKSPRESVSTSAHGYLRQKYRAAGWAIRLQTKPL